jgi:hypothetical protein
MLLAMAVIFLGFSIDVLGGVRVDGWSTANWLSFVGFIFPVPCTGVWSWRLRCGGSKKLKLNASAIFRRGRAGFSYSSPPDLIRWSMLISGVRAPFRKHFVSAASAWIAGISE